MSATEADALLGVVLFTQDGCPESTRARACLRAGGVSFAEQNVTGDPAAAEALLATGTFATPLVLAGGRVLFGLRPPALAAALGFRCRCPDAGRPAGAGDPRIAR